MIWARLARPNLAREGAESGLAEWRLAAELEESLHRGAGLRIGEGAGERLGFGEEVLVYTALGPKHARLGGGDGVGRVRGDPGGEVIDEGL